MRNCDPDFSAELEKEMLSSFHLIEFTLRNDTYRFTDGDVPVYYAGVRYDPRDFEFDNLAISSSLSVDRTTLTIDNADLVLSAMLLGEDCRNRPVTLYQGLRLSAEGMQMLFEAGVAFEAGVDFEQVRGTTGYVAEIIFRGVVEGWRIGEKTALIDVCNEMIIWSKKTLRKQGSSCPWTFKGEEECRYAGSETWCDQTYERCAALLNTDNFGAERFLPAVIEKKLYWGKATRYA